MQKADSRTATGMDTTTLAKSSVDILDIDKLKYVPTLKRKVDKSDVDKLVPIPVDLSKQSHAVKMSLKKLYIMLR